MLRHAAFVHRVMNPQPTRAVRERPHGHPRTASSNHVPRSYDFFLSFVCVSAEAARILAWVGVACPVLRTFDAMDATAGDVRSFFAMVCS